MITKYSCKVCAEDYDAQLRESGLLTVDEMIAHEGKGAKIENVEHSIVRQLRYTKKEGREYYGVMNACESLGGRF